MPLLIWRVRLARFWRREIAHLRPSGLFNWHYLQPRLPPLPAWHRALWWRSRNRLPRLLWILLEGFRILYWRGIGHRGAVAGAEKAVGEQIARAEGIPVDLQRARIRGLAVHWCIAPAEAYAFGLYRDGQDALSRLYDREQQAYHRLMNARCGAGKADYRLVQDKYRLAERLTAVGVPVVATRRLSDGSGEDLVSALSEAQAVFCKLRFGSRGEGAFMAESAGAGLTGRTLAGEVLENEAAVMAAWKTLAGKGPLLIQPYLRSHPLLQSLAPEADSIALRVITRLHGAAAAVWMGLLYVQAPGDLPEREYWLLQIDAESGRAVDAFGHWLGADNGAGNEPSGCSPRCVLGGQVIPFWQDTVRHSMRAHAELPRLWSIAWDWIITPDGPVLLEGNAGWDMSPLQSLGVDFAAICREAGPNRAG